MGDLLELESPRALERAAEHSVRVLAFVGFERARVNPSRERLVEWDAEPR